MSTGTRLLLFHEDGELRQIYLPRLSLLWVLGMISTLSLLTVILFIVGMRLYHEKREASAVVDHLRARVSALQTQVDTAAQPAPEPRPTERLATGGMNSLASQVYSFLQWDPKAPSLATSPLEIIPGASLHAGAKRLHFSIKVKEAREEPIEGYVCGLMFLSQGFSFLMPAQGARWDQASEIKFSKGETCDSFKIKSVKWYDLPLAAPITAGWLALYAPTGEILAVHRIDKEVP